MIFLPRNHKFFATSRRGRWWLDLRWDELNGWLVVVISIGQTYCWHLLSDETVECSSTASGH